MQSAVQNSSSLSKLRLQNDQFDFLKENLKNIHMSQSDFQNNAMFVVLCDLKSF